MASGQSVGSYAFKCPAGMERLAAFRIILLNTPTALAAEVGSLAPAKPASVSSKNRGQSAFLKLVYVLRVLGGGLAIRKGNGDRQVV